jgi:hypothetical protein
MMTGRYAEALMPRTEKPLQTQPHLEQPLGIDRVEAFLVALPLRRYVTWCARRRPFAQMIGAARALDERSSTWS